MLEKPEKSQKKKAEIETGMLRVNTFCQSGVTAHPCIWFVRELCQCRSHGCTIKIFLKEKGSTYYCFIKQNIFNKYWFGKIGKSVRNNKI